MKNNLRKILVGGFGFVLCLAAFAVSAKADQPFMKEARKNLDNAMKYLKIADTDKGGHRKKAADLTSQAISAVKDGIEYDRQHPKDAPRRNSNFDESNSFEATGVSFDQPNMLKARNHLQNALANLQKATADKGGYRVKAMDLVRQAIAEVNLGIEYDRTH